MRRHTWTKEDDKILAKMQTDGLSVSDIAEALSRTYDSVNSRIYRNRITDAVPPSKMPLYDKPLRSSGDCVVLSDVEAPFQNSEFINRVIDLAYAWGVNDLHFAGDLLHYDSLSMWGSEWTEDQENLRDALMDIVQLLDKKKRESGVKLLEERGLLAEKGYSEEMSESRAVFKSFNQFKNIYVELGNHDDRYLRTLDKALSSRELLFELDVNKDPRWKIAPYYYAVVETEAGEYRITHPRGAGKNTAIDLATQFHQHIIMGHSHAWSINLDPSSKYWAIQQGCCVDERRLAYVMQRDAKRFQHINGATIIRGGYPYVLNPMSDWNRLKRL